MKSANGENPSVVTKGSNMAEKRDMILRAVMRIINEDYAGQSECASRNDTQQWLAAFASAWKAGTLDDKLFMQYMTQYLAGFQDPSLVFEASEEADCEAVTCGFSVRRYGDELYVTQVREDDRFTPGDTIVLLNKSKPDEHLAYMIGNPVNGDNPERQLWDDIVARCAHVLVHHADGAEEDIPVKRFSKPDLVASLRPPSVEVREGTGPNGDECAVIITVHHFADTSVLQTIQRHFDDIQHANRVIVDVRDVEEGMIGNALGLLALFFDCEINLKDLMGQEIMYTRYTERNTQLRAMQLASLLDMSDEAARSWIQAEIDHVAACANQGFVKEAEFEEDMLFPPAPQGQKTLLLTDVCTSGPGERLVSIAQHAAAQGCGKVRCVGRATRGSLDYTNLIAVAFDEKFSLVYPMSKTEAAYEGRGTLGQGLAPDVYIPFTPGECTEDLVLERALVEP